MENARELIKKYKVIARKSLGQNFLTDEKVVENILDAAYINENDLVIEIGPGLGIMTEPIAKRAGKVVAVELDKNLIPILNGGLFGLNVTVINKDILKVDIDNEIIKPYGIKEDGTQYKIKVVSNLPYYITTPIIMKLLEDGIKAELMIFMVQLEVADRMCANPGSKVYGSLSVAVKYYSEPEKLFNVPPGCFIPRPKVDSGVVRLTVREKFNIDEELRKIFFKLVKAAFGQRRKTLINAILNSGNFQVDKERLKEILKEMGLSEDIRGERLSIDLFLKLAEKTRKNTLISRDF